MEKMLERSLSSDSASWDPLNFDDPASVLPNEQTSFQEMGTDDLEEPGWLKLQGEDNMFWGDEHPQSVASHLEMSPAETALHSPADKLQQVDSSFMSCGSSVDTASRCPLFPEEQQAPLVPSKSVIEGMLREVLVINGLPLEARAKAMGAWMKKAQRYGNDFYNQCVARAVSTLSTMRTSNPLATSDKGSSCLDEPSSMDSPRSFSKRSRDDTELSPNSWPSAGASKRQKMHAAAYHSNDHEAEGGTFATFDSLAPESRRSPFMISNPSVHSRPYSASSSQKSSFADMDQQLGALMSDEPLFADGFGTHNTDSLSAPNYNFSSHNSQKLDGVGWETSAAMPFDDVAPGEDLPPCFMQALYTMCNDGGQLVDL